MSQREAAKVLGVGVATVNRDLSFQDGTEIVPERNEEPVEPANPDSKRVHLPAREEKREAIVRKNEALAAVEATLNDGREADRRPDGKGGYFITLPHGVLDWLNYLREPGQSYSDVILALAKSEGARPTR